MEISTASAKNSWIKVVNKLSGHTPVAHHGIQRSGTNYLNLCLGSLGVRPVNAFDPSRGSSSHKHCRWQHDKESIMPWDVRYKNNYLVSELAELDRMAGYPRDCRHLIIQKNLSAWLPSILNWGLRVGWFSTKAEAISEGAPKAKQDYSHYYDFWRQMADKNPDRVAVIQFESLIADPRSLIRICESLTIKLSNTVGFDGKFAEVPKSPMDRVVSIERSDVEPYL